MTAPTESEIDAVIAGLSANMTLALIHSKVASDGSRWMNLATTPRTSRSLERRGLLSGPLTPLGLAVRARLEAMRDG